MLHNLKIYILFLIFLLPSLALSQSQSAPSIDLDSPYNTMFVHLYYLQADSYQPELAAKTIQGLDSLSAIEAAIELKQVLDGKGLYIHLNLLPQQNDYLDSISQQPFYTPFPKELPAVYLEKTNGKWYFSNETIKKIPGLHKKVYPFGTDFIVNLIPGGGQQRFLGLAFWQYLSIAILLLFAWLFNQIVSTVIRPLIKKGLKRFLDEGDKSKQLVLSIARFVSLILITYLVRLLLPIVQLPIGMAKVSVLALNVVLTVFFVLLALRILDLIMTFFGRYARQTNHKMDEQLIPIIRRAFWFLFVIGGLVQVLRLLDVNVTALIAGISIGGLALALAAQDTVKNLIGSLMIFIDQPFQIDDYIEWGGMAGTVVEVGFRTTRIKTSDTSIIAVPNGTIANNAVTNKGMRTYRLFNGILGLKYNTSQEAIRFYIKGLHGILDKHPAILQENKYVHLTALADSSISVTYKAYIDLKNFESELQIKEDLLMAFMALAEKLKIEFAFPSSSIYVEMTPDKPIPTTTKVELEGNYATILHSYLERLSFDSGEKEA